MSRIIPPSVTYPSPNEWPNAVRTITNITRANNAQVTSTDHGFTQGDDSGITGINFTQVQGMIQINARYGIIQTVIDTDNFTVNINSTDFFAYTSGGQLQIVSGHAPYDPFQNIA